MTLEPSWIEAAAAAGGLVVTWTTCVTVIVIWIFKRIEQVEIRILKDFKEKHEENNRTIKAIESLVIRHDVLLNPEFNGDDRRHRRV